MAASPRIEHGGPLLSEPQQAAAQQRTHGRGGDHRPALRLSDHVSAAAALRAIDHESRRVAERLKHRMPNRVRPDGKHGGSIAAAWLLAFGSEQFLLALHAPAIAGERASGADDAMARHQHRHAVERAGAGHGARGVGVAQLAGKLRVGLGLSARNLPEGLPDAKLKNGAAKIEAFRAGVALDKVRSFANTLESS